MEYLNINEILPNPFQPRCEFNADELNELAKSIKEYGIIEPLVVRINNNDEFELIAGERRLRASKLAGLETVPVILKDYDDRRTAQIALIENVQRANLNAIEEANAYQALLQKFCMTQEEIAQKVGKSRSHIANIIRLLKLAAPVQALVSANKLSMGQAKPLLAIEDEALQIKVAEMIIEQDLSARKVETLVKQVLKSVDVLEDPVKEDNESVYLTDMKEQLKQILGTNVNIKQGKKKSKIEIEFYSEDDLMRLIEVITNKTQKSMSEKIVKNFTI